MGVCRGLEQKRVNNCATFQSTLDIQPVLGTHTNWLVGIEKRRRREKGYNLVRGSPARQGVGGGAGRTFT